MAFHERSCSNERMEELEAHRSGVGRNLELAKTNQSHSQREK